MSNDWRAVAEKTEPHVISLTEKQAVDLVKYLELQHDHEAAGCGPDCGPWALLDGLRKLGYKIERVGRVG